VNHAIVERLADKRGSVPHIIKTRLRAAAGDNDFNPRPMLCSIPRERKSVGFAGHLDVRKEQGHTVRVHREKGLGIITIGRLIEAKARHPQNVTGIHWDHGIVIDNQGLGDGGELHPLTTIEDNIRTRRRSIKGLVGVSRLTPGPSLYAASLRRAIRVLARSGNDRLTGARRKSSSEKRQPLSARAQPGPINTTALLSIGRGTQSRQRDQANIHLRARRVTGGHRRTRRSGQAGFTPLFEAHPWVGSRPYTINPQGSGRFATAFFVLEKSDRGPFPSCRAPVERG